MEETKPFKISKQIVKTAFDRVKANKGTYGIDEQSITDFEENLKNNLYKIWNRMSSGTYFPKPVKAVEIPKKSGGTRILGIPTVEDYFSVVDVIAALTGSSIPRNYWSDLKRKLRQEGSQLHENIVQLKMKVTDGKMRETDTLDTKGILRLIESIPSPKAEPFKLWLAKMGNDRIDIYISILGSYFSSHIFTWQRYAISCGPSRWLSEKNTYQFC